MISLPSILLRLSVALLLGAVMGWERESRQRSAGMRTNALVALGSCLFTLISGFGFSQLLGIAHVQIDPTRIASYVVAGIGFLGGGTIIVQHDRVKGLTTAAVIWLVAALGMACGAGWLWEAMIAALLALAALLGLRLLEQRKMFEPRHSLQRSDIQLEVMGAADSFIGQVQEACERKAVTIERLDIKTERESKTVNLACHAQNTAALASVVDALQTLPAVRAVHIELADKSGRAPGS
ncbi:MAG: MgtC/SapB family protein [Ktedonobacteraceae bacterium]|nr:MgtC/SapB family protein [Ktedonobacteraceae bacterium]MBV9019841.1 MgtC/SapB family protein [Ktedonobacteraceae bacterium]